MEHRGGIGVMTAAGAVLLLSASVAFGHVDGEGRIFCEASGTGHAQGVCSDGTNIWWSTTYEIIRTDMTGKVLGMFRIPTGSHHLGDLTCRGGRLYVGVNNRFGIDDRYVWRKGDEIWTIDSRTMKRIDVHPTPEAAWCNNGVEYAGGYFWVVSSAPQHHEFNYLFQYDAKFRFRTCIPVKSGWTNLGVQTIKAVEGKLLLGCYGSPKDPTMPHEGCTLVIDLKEALAAALPRNDDSVQHPKPLVAVGRRTGLSSSEGFFVVGDGYYHCECTNTKRKDGRGQDCRPWLRPIRRWRQLLKIGCDEVELRPGEAEVVVAPKAPSIVRFAGEEMTNCLSRVLSAPVPLVAKPTPGRKSVILGVNEWSKAAGVDPSTLPRDGYIVRAEGDRIYIVGADDPRFDLHGFLARREGYGDLLRGHERATLFGVYGCLEKYAGVRFILPDEELGTIAPARPSVSFPCGERRVVPDFLIRDPYFGGDGRWYVKDCGGRAPKTMLWLRHRLSTCTIPCCHGSAEFKYIERFGATHPEYFARRKDGSVCLDPKRFSACQYCWSDPGFREELYRDVKAYLTGRPASERGLKRWGINCMYGKYVDIMPDDAFSGCYCERCRKAYTGPITEAGWSGSYATDLIWGYCREVGERLIREGVKGDITMMSYPPYVDPPAFDLPTNVQVMVAKSGPWSLTNARQHAADAAGIRSWARKVGHKVWIWTYPSKFGAMMIKGVPCVGPHAWGRYYAELHDAIIGTFAECESDESIYNFLNYYVFAHVMWDKDTDVDALLDEAYALLFGAGRQEMKRFFERLEELWTKKVVGAIRDTPLGPKTVRPDNRTLWRTVYSPEVRAELGRLVAAAEAKTPSGSADRKRVALMRREFYDRICAGAAEFEEQMRTVASLRHDITSGPVRLKVLNAEQKCRDPVPVSTSVTVRDLGAALEFAFDCEEPDMANVVAPYEKPGELDNWQNNGVEVFLNPNGDRKTLYHVMLSHRNTASFFLSVNGSGMPPQAIDVPGFATSTSVTPRGWKGVVRIPKAALEGLGDECPAEFGRYRARKGTVGEMIQWSPHAHNFCDIERYGTIILRK